MSDRMKQLEQQAAGLADGDERPWYQRNPGFVGGRWHYYNARADQNGTPVYTLSCLPRDVASIHDGLWLADIRRGGDGDAIDHRQGMSNAAVIASAPDLFFACQKAIEFIDQFADKGASRDEIAAIRTRLAIALAKAFGPWGVRGFDRHTPASEAAR